MVYYTYIVRKKNEKGTTQQTNATAPAVNVTFTTNKIYYNIAIFTNSVLNTKGLSKFLASA